MLDTIPQTITESSKVGPPPIHSDSDDDDDRGNHHHVDDNNNNNNNNPYHGGGKDKDDFNMDHAEIGYTDHDIDVNLFLKNNFDPCFIINNSKYVSWKKDTIYDHIQLGTTSIDYACYPVGSLLVKIYGNTPPTITNFTVQRNTGYSSTETTEVQRDFRLSYGIKGASIGYKIRYINGKNYIFVGINRNDTCISKNDCSFNIPTEKAFIDYLAANPSKWVLNL
ncbi:hypothetical protein ACTFIR_007861 [Dictyostelium discoideum]